MNTINPGGLLWFDDDVRRSIQEKIAEAAQRFRERMGYEPTVCQLNPAQASALESGADRAVARPKRAQAAKPALPPIALRLVPSDLIQPHCYLIGVGEGEEPRPAVLPYRDEPEVERAMAAAPARASQSYRASRTAVKPARRPATPAAPVVEHPVLQPAKAVAATAAKPEKPSARKVAAAKVAAAKVAAAKMAATNVAATNVAAAKKPMVATSITAEPTAAKPATTRHARAKLATTKQTTTRPPTTKVTATKPASIKVTAPEPKVIKGQATKPDGSKKTTRGKATAVVQPAPVAKSASAATRTKAARQRAQARVEQPTLIGVAPEPVVAVRTPAALNRPSRTRGKTPPTQQMPSSGKTAAALIAMPTPIAAVATAAVATIVPNRRKRATTAPVIETPTLPLIEAPAPRARRARTHVA
jgi:hypothetical protein